MSSPSNTRTIKFKKICDNGVQIECKQKQIKKGWWIFSWWSDDGKPQCPDCPKDLDPSKKVIVCKCLVGVYVILLDRATGPGLLGALIKEWALPGHPPPPIKQPIPLPKCAEMDYEHCKKLIELLEYAKEHFRKQGWHNQVQTQQKAIDCLKKSCKDIWS